MMRLFLLIGSSANTPQPWSFERRRTILGNSASCMRKRITTLNRRWELRVPVDNSEHMSGTGLRAREMIQAWGKILSGYRPNISVEITKECPLRCPGCYAYGDEHLGGDVTLRGLADYKGDELIERFMALIDRHKPLHVSIVGGEPLVRYRELGQILPQLSERGIHTQVVTSAVRPIPEEWIGMKRLQI